MDYEQRYTTKPRVDHVNVLGTIYQIEIRKASEDLYMKDHETSVAYCDTDEKLIVLSDFTEEAIYGEKASEIIENMEKYI